MIPLAHDVRGTYYACADLDLAQRDCSCSWLNNQLATNEEVYQCIGKSVSVSIGKSDSKYAEDRRSVQIQGREPFIANNYHAE